MPNQGVGRVMLVVTVLVVGLLAGCAAPRTTQDPEPDDSEREGGVALAHYLHDVSEPIAGLSLFDAIVEQHPILSDDGVRLDTWVVRPNVDAPVPIVLMITAYFGGGPPVDPALEATGIHSLWPVGEPLFTRGYAVAISSIRGTGNSEGCFAIGGPQEARDSAIVIETLASQPWSNGHVGLIGVSNDGTAAQNVWVEAPPALKTIVPVAATSDAYKYTFVNGVPIQSTGQAFNIYYWAIFGATPANGYGAHLGVGALDPIAFATATPGEACGDHIETQEAGASSAIDGNKDSFWQQRDLLAALRETPEKARASVFYIHGLADWNVKPNQMEDWLDALYETGVPIKAHLGQWGHTFPIAMRPDWLHLELVAWFDQFLKGVDTGILDAPAVQVQSSDGRWRHEARWPPTEVEWLTLYPSLDGRLGGALGHGEVTYSDLDPSGMQGHVRNAPRDMIAWQSGVLADDWHLAGQPVFEANVTATAMRAALMLTLVERTPEGDRSINYAAMSLNHVASLEQGDFDISDKTQTVRVRFFPQDTVVQAGSRLMLVAAGDFIHNSGTSIPMVAQTSGPDLIPPSQGGTITIALERASLMLPLDHTLVYEEP